MTLNRTFFPCLLLLVGILSGCAGSKSQPVRYYLIDPVEFDSLVNQQAEPLRIEVIDLHIPQYLERFHIATRNDENRLAVSDYHQWGENLRKNLLRTLSRNLSQLLASHDIGTPLNRSASVPDYRLQVYIEQFEQDVDGYVRLFARWQITIPGEQVFPAIYAAELQSDRTIADKDYDAIVSAMRELYGSLTHDIAKTIVQRE